MAEEILNTAIPEEEAPIAESPIVESTIVEESIPDGKENLKLLHSALSGDTEYTDLVPKDFNKFIEQYKDPQNATLLFQSLRGDKEYSDMIPSDPVKAASMFGVTINAKGLGKPSAVPSASVDGGSATKGRGVEQPSTSYPTNDEEFKRYREENLEQFKKALSGDGAFPETFTKLTFEYLKKIQPPGMDLGNRSIIETGYAIAGKTLKEVKEEFGIDLQPKKPSNQSSAKPFGFGLSPELQSAVGGISEEMSKEGEKYSNEKNAFKEYERLQTYFSKVDKVKRGGVGSGMNRSGIPESQEDQNIRADAFSGKYDMIKRQAELAQVKMSESLKPIIEKDITEKYLKKNDDGFLVPDEAKIDEYAKNIAKRYGLSDSGFLKEVVYNEATSMAAFREREPDIIKRFEKYIQPNLVATGLIEKSNQEVWKNFTTDEVEQAELDKKVGTLAADLKVKSKADENAVQYELQKQVSNLNMSYAQMQAQTSAQFENLDNQYKNGMPRDQYEAAFNKLQEASKQSYDVYTDERLKLFDEGQKSLNQISNKYNAQLRRQAEELNNIAREKVNKAALEYQKKYGKNPKLEAEIKKLYEKAYLESVDEKNTQIAKYKKDRTTGLILKYKQFGGMVAMADRFLRSIDSAAGGSLKGIGTSLGIDSLQLYGDFLQGSVSLPEAKTKEWSDLFDPMNLSQLTGQLVGSMTPAIVASTAVAGLTRNAPLAYKMAAIGVARFWVESSDIAGRMRDETFARTQSVSKANIASEKSWESQYKIIPFYSLSGLPFINTAGTWMKTLPRVARVALGAGAQLVEEVPQETLQGIAEENIRAELDPFDDYYKKISEDDWKRLKETTITVAPVMILGGGAELSGRRELTKKQQMKQQVDSYAAQAKVNELVGNMQGQWVSQMVAKKGDAFAIATINALFTDGTIDEQTRDQLQENVTTSKKNFEDANTLGLSQSEGVVYDALTQAYLEKKAQYEQAQQNGDEILADNLNADMTNIRNQAKEFAQNKQGDFFVFQFQDGSQKIVTNSNWSSDAEILDLIASDQISVSAYSENGKALLDSITPKVEEQKVAQKRTTEEKLKAQREMEAEDLIPQSEQTQQTEEAPQAESTTEGNVAIDGFTGEAKDIINESINEINEDIEYYKEKVRKLKPTTKAGKFFRSILFKSYAEKQLESYENDLKLLNENPIEYYKKKLKNWSKDRDMTEYFQDKINILESNKVAPQAQAAPPSEATQTSTTTEAQPTTTTQAEATTTQESNKASIEVTDVPTDSSPSLRGNINTPNGRGHFTASVLDDGTAYISDIQIGDFQSDDKSRGKGYGLDAYIQIGKKLKELGYNLESTQWDKHISGISPQALRVWEKLKELGYAKVISQKQNKVYNRETGEEEVKQTNVYEFVSEPTTQSQPTPTTEAQTPVAEEAQAPVAEEVKATSTIDIKLDSDAKIEARMAEIEGDKSKQGEFDEMEKEMERRERSSVFDVPLSEVSSAIDALNQKEKDKPNGFGAFIEKRDARETKGVADKYLNAEEITDRELKRDFTDAVLGNPDTWYADGLKLRESINEATRRGINLQELIADVEQKFINDGFTLEDAKATIQRRLAPVFNGAEIVQENEPKSIEQQAPQSFPAQEGAASEQEKEFKAHPELEQVYRDLHAAVTKNVDPNTLEAVKRNPTLVMVEKALRELERKGVIKIDCN